MVTISIFKVYSNSSSPHPWKELPLDLTLLPVKDKIYKSLKTLNITNSSPIHFFNIHKN